MQCVRLRAARLLIPLAAVFALAGCSTGKDLDLKEAASVHRIALIEPHGPDQYLVGSNRSSGSITGNGSLLGDIIKSSRADNDTNRQFRADLAQENLKLGADLGAALESALRQDGYDVVSVSLPASQPEELIQDLSSLKGKADAALDVAIRDAGYAYATGHPYEPSIDVAVQLTDLGTQKVLFRRTYTYGRYQPEQGVADEMIPPDAGYEFRGGGDLLKDPARAAAGLRSSVPHLAERIGSALKQ